MLSSLAPQKKIKFVSRCTYCDEVRFQILAWAVWVLNNVSTLFSFSDFYSVLTKPVLLTHEGVKANLSSSSA